MKNMSCDIELGQNVDLSWMNSWINTENEGSLCFLSLPNTQDGWILNDENFSCGSSGVLILMCDKAFKLLEKVSKYVLTNFKQWFVFVKNGLHLRNAKNCSSALKKVVISNFRWLLRLRPL